MKKSVKTMLLVIATIFVLGGVSILIYEFTKEEVINVTTDDIEGNEYVEVDSTTGSKINTSKNFTKTKKFLNYEFKNAALSYFDGETTFTADVTNLKSKTKSVLVEIIFYNDKKEAISKMGTYIRELEKEETMELNASITRDMANAYDYKVVLKEDK